MSLAGLIAGGINSTSLGNLDLDTVRQETSGKLDFLEQAEDNNNSFWNILDSIKEPVASALGTTVNAFGARLADNVSNGAAARQTTIGDVDDQHRKGQQFTTQSFFQKNKTLVIAGGVVAAVGVFLLLKGK